MKSHSPVVDLRVVYSLTQDERKSVLDFLMSKVYRPHYHNPDWVEWVEPYKRPIYFMFYENEKLSCFAIVYERMSFCSLKFGPVMLNDGMLMLYLLRISGYLRKLKFGLLAVHLPFLKDNNRLPSLFKEFGKLNVLNFDRTGWSTVHISLVGRTIESVFQGFSMNHKRSIKKAIKEGLEAKLLTDKKYLKRFAGIYNSMHHRKGLVLPLPDAERAFNSIFNANIGIFIGVFYKDELLGGAIFLSEGDRLLYKFGATDVAHHEKPVLHLAIYEMIKFSIEEKYEKFDLCGYTADASPGSYSFGVNRFKRGFGGEVVEYTPSFSIKLNPISFYFSNSMLFVSKNIPDFLRRVIYKLSG